jgi:hypothetical protein
LILLTFHTDNYKQISINISPAELQSVGCLAQGSKGARLLHGLGGVELLQVAVAGRVLVDHDVLLVPRLPLVAGSGFIACMLQATLFFPQNFLKKVEVLAFPVLFVAGLAAVGLDKHLPE